MANELPYKEIIDMQLKAGHINYKVTNSNNKLDTYIISFDDYDIVELSTCINHKSSKKEIHDRILEALVNSQQGKTFVELSYLEEHLALADCRDYSVEQDVNAYLVYMKLSETTEVYGAICKNYSISEVSLFATKKLFCVDTHDVEATTRMKNFGRNVMADRTRSIYR